MGPSLTTECAKLIPFSLFAREDSVTLSLLGYFAYPNPIIHPLKLSSNPTSSDKFCLHYISPHWLFFFFFFFLFYCLLLPLSLPLPREGKLLSLLPLTEEPPRALSPSGSSSSGSPARWCTDLTPHGVISPSAWGCWRLDTFWSGENSPGRQPQVL